MQLICTGPYKCAHTITFEQTTKKPLSSSARVRGLNGRPISAIDLIIWALWHSDYATGRALLSNPFFRIAKYLMQENTTEKSCRDTRYIYTYILYITSSCWQLVMPSHSWSSSVSSVSWHPIVCQLCENGRSV